MQYKLSICIPTHNRAKYLPELLDSIIEQVDANNPVEICISDNASEDDTAELVKAYKNKYPHIVYFRWPTNMGADRNYLKVVEIASGEYCWFVGSDDKLVEHSLFKVLNKISALNCSIYLFSRILCDLSLRPLQIDRCLDAASYYDRVFQMSKKNDFILYSLLASGTITYFSYLSIIIFRRDRWCAVNDNDMFIGTAFCHVFKLLVIVANGCDLYCSNSPIVFCRLDNDSFFHGDRAERYLLDLVGYEKIAKVVFAGDLLHYACVMSVVQKGIRLNNIKNRLMILSCSSEENFYALAVCYSVVYGFIKINFLDKFIIRNRTVFGWLFGWYRAFKKMGKSLIKTEQRIKTS
jgi:abequosyltransferase